MSEEAVSSVPESRSKKRKLRYPRTSNACNFCRKRKVRCSGTYPCDYCVREEVTCEYASRIHGRALSPQAEDNSRTSTSRQRPEQFPGTYEQNHDDSRDSSRANSALNTASRRSSIGAPQEFVHGHHIGPTSGVSFLYHPWDKTHGQDTRTALQGSNEGPLISHAPLVSYGDIPQLNAGSLKNLPEPNFTVVRMLEILDRYFQYISPTYRYLHHPTCKEWAVAHVNQDKQLTIAQKATVLLTCAQTFLHTSANPGDPEVGRGDLMLSMSCFERAKSLLDKEPGPPSLASVQARIGMCLYLLSTFRLNECRYCFSFAVTVATALGIHRRQSSSRVDPLEGECRKRTFWSLYVLDSYLSVMLGRPRLLRDDDIDQPYPHNIDDHDLVSSEPIESLPKHGNLEAFINHAKLAKLTARNNDLLYPLHSLTNDELLQRSNEMLDALLAWQNELPEFLKPRERTLTGQRTFERQNTILKLALAHARILATRRCLLTDFGHVDANPFSQSQDTRAKRSVQECISAIVTTLDTVEALIQNGQCYGSFWSTQYIALVAISSFYVIIIQGVRHALPGDIASFLDVEENLSKAKRCHEHLAKLPPSGSQAERHHSLLAHLRSKAERTLAKHRSLAENPGRASRRSRSSVGQAHSGGNQNIEVGVPMTANVNDATNASVQTSLAMPSATEIFSASFADNVTTAGMDVSGGLPMFSTILTPNSGSDASFQYLLDLGWESLDTIGIPMPNYEVL